MDTRTDTGLATRGGLRAAVVRRLTEARIDGPEREAAWILTDALGIDRAALIGWPEAPVPAAHAERALAWTERRASGEPLQYVVGYAEFLGRRFVVDPSVLVPRPETEELVEHVLDRLADRSGLRVLDVGTGSGCIAATIALERPGDEVTAVDVSAAALATARANAERTGARVRFVEADVLDAAFATWAGGPFDVVVSNPPYVASGEALPDDVALHEPHLALFAPGDALGFYRTLAALVAGPAGAPGCLLAVEVHADRGRAVAGIFERAGLRRPELGTDLAGRDRICTAFRPSD